MDYSIGPDRALNPEEYGFSVKAGFIAVTVLCLFAGYFTVAWKFVSNVRDHLRVKPGDCLAAAGLLLATGFAVACNKTIAIGGEPRETDDSAVGREAREIHAASEYARGTHTAILLYNSSLLCAKLSLLCFHWSIGDWIESRSRMLKWTSIMLAGVVGVYHFTSFFVYLLQSPSLGNWLNGDNNVRSFMIGTSVLDLITLIAVLAVIAPVLVWQWSSQQHQYFKSKIMATLVCGLLSLPLTLARVPMLAANTKPNSIPPLALPVTSLLVLTLLLLSALFLHPSGHLTASPSASTIEEISKMDHHHWRTPSDLPYLQERGRPLARSRGHSGTDFGSINSHTRLFPGRERVDRSRTPDPSSYFSTDEKIEIQVQYEVTRTVEDRKGRTRGQDAEKGLEGV